MLLIIGFVSLMLMDRDQTISDSHGKLLLLLLLTLKKSADAHSHHRGLHYLRHVIDLFGFGDHQGGVLILFLALLLRSGLFLSVSVLYSCSFRL